MPVRTYKGVRLGTADEAGKLCVTDTKPDGVNRDTFRKMDTMPGPWVDPATKAPSRDPVKGQLEYDLDEVERRNAARNGSTGWTTTERRTERRHSILRRLAAGEILWDVGRRRLVDRHGELLTTGNQHTTQPRFVNSFVHGGYVRLPPSVMLRRRGPRPAPGEKLAAYEFTAAGKTLLERWNAEAPNAAAAEEQEQRQPA